MKKRKMPWGVFDRLSLYLFNFLLLILAIMIPALLIASSHSYYHGQFEKNNIYGYVDAEGEEVLTAIYYIDGNPYRTAQFTNEQLNSIADHIVDYLFGNKEDFTLVMDGVLVNGIPSDGVRIFSERSVSHMADVKDLIQAVTLFSWVGGSFLLLLLAYFLWRRQSMRKLFLKHTARFYLGVFCAVALFFFVSLLFKEPHMDLPLQIWVNLHYILFAFQPEKIEGSFLLDALTQILTLELFLSAIYIIIAVVLLVIALWVGAILLFFGGEGQKTFRFLWKRREND